MIPNEEEPKEDEEEVIFTYAEALHALGWGAPDDEQRRMAKYISNDPALLADDPEWQAMQPVAVNYSKDMLIPFSLVSEETNAKVERYLEERRLGGVPWGPTERAAYDVRRAEIREGLIKAGKIKDKD